MERFFIPEPVPTGTISEARKLDDATFPLYRENDGNLLKWSGDFPLPKVGDRIYITMNGIGWAYVMGYFASEDYLGVMTLATKPPAWLRQLNRKHAKDASKPEWIRRGIGCEFGTEIALKNPRVKRQIAVQEVK
jgi:hypothetical protein